MQTDVYRFALGFAQHAIDYGALLFDPRSTVLKGFLSLLRDEYNPGAGTEDAVSVFFDKLDAELDNYLQDAETWEAYRYHCEACAYSASSRYGQEATSRLRLRREKKSTGKVKEPVAAGSAGGGETPHEPPNPGDMKANVVRGPMYKALRHDGIAKGPKALLDMQHTMRGEDDHRAENPMIVFWQSVRRDCRLALQPRRFHGDACYGLGVLLGECLIGHWAHQEEYLHHRKDVPRRLHTFFTAVSRMFHAEPAVKPARTPSKERPANSTTQSLPAAPAVLEGVYWNGVANNSLWINVIWEIFTHTVPLLRANAASCIADETKGGGTPLVPPPKKELPKTVEEAVSLLDSVSKKCGTTSGRVARLILIQPHITEKNTADEVEQIAAKHWGLKAGSDTAWTKAKRTLVELNMSFTVKSKLRLADIPPIWKQAAKEIVDQLPSVENPAGSRKNLTAARKDKL